MRRIAVLAGALLVVVASAARASIVPDRSATASADSCSLKPYGTRSPLPEGSLDDMTGATSCLVVRATIDGAPAVRQTKTLVLSVTADRLVPAGPTDFVLQLPPGMSIVSPGTDLKIRTVPSTKTDGTIRSIVSGAIGLTPGETTQRSFHLKPTATGRGTVRAIVADPLVADPTAQASVSLTYGADASTSHIGFEPPAIGGTSKLPSGAKPVALSKGLYNHPLPDTSIARRRNPVKGHAAGTACAVGDFSYTDQNGDWHPARNVTVQAVDRNAYSSDTVLGTGQTDSLGHYSICFANTDTGYMESGGVDLYVTFDLTNPAFTVHDPDGRAYYWQTGTTKDIPSGTFNVGSLTAADSTLMRALHLYDEVQSAWMSIPGCWDELGACTRKEMRWSPTLDTWPAVWGDDRIARIPGPGPDSPAVVIHELGHEVMIDAYDGYWPPGDCTSPHFINASEDPGCAWREGWPNWFAGHVLQNGQLGWWNAPTNGKSGDALVFYNLKGSTPANTLLEDATWADTGNDDGDTVETRISTAMWDYEDNAQDGFWDRKTNGFLPLWNTFQHSNSGTFSQFWSDLASNGYDNSSSDALSTLFQNTIDLGGNFKFNDPLTLGKKYTLPDIPRITPMFTHSDNYYPFKFLRSSSCINVTAKPKSSRVISMLLYSDAAHTKPLGLTFGGPKPQAASITLAASAGSPAANVYGKLLSIGGDGAVDVSMVGCLILHPKAPVTLPANVIASPLSISPTAGSTITVTVTPKARGSVRATADARVDLVRVPTDPAVQGDDSGDVPIVSVNEGAAGRPETLRYTFPSQLPTGSEYVLNVRTLSGDGAYRVSLG